MAQSPMAPEVTVWTDARGVAAARQVLDRMGSSVRPIGVGGPQDAQLDALAAQWDCPRGDDMRKLLVDRPAKFVLLTTMWGIGSDDVAEALAAGSTVLTLEPARAEISNRRRNARNRRGRGGPAAGDTVVLMPAFDQSEGWASAADPMQVVGPAALVGFSSWGGPDSGSLYSRLYDAWCVVLRFGPMPDSVDASLVAPDGQVSEDLRTMTGHMAVHARQPGGVRDCCVVIDASDRAAVLARQLRVVGDDGQFCATDHDYSLYTVSGKLLDGNPSGRPPTGTYSDLIAQHWRRLLDRPGIGDLEPRDPHEDVLIACCLACLLSARTGQPESPQKLLQAHGHA